MTNIQALAIMGAIIWAAAPLNKSRAALVSDSLLGGAFMFLALRAWWA